MPIFFEVPSYSYHKPDLHQTAYTLSKVDKYKSVKFSWWKHIWLRNERQNIGASFFWVTLYLHAKIPQKEQGVKNYEYYST